MIWTLLKEWDALEEHVIQGINENDDIWFKSIGC